MASFSAGGMMEFRIYENRAEAKIWDVELSIEFEKRVIKDRYTIGRVEAYYFRNLKVNGESVDSKEYYPSLRDVAAVAVFFNLLGLTLWADVCPRYEGAGRFIAILFEELNKPSAYITYDYITMKMECPLYDGAGTVELIRYWGAVDVRDWDTRQRYVFYLEEDFFDNPRKHHFGYLLHSDASSNDVQFWDVDVIIDARDNLAVVVALIEAYRDLLREEYFDEKVLLGVEVDLVKKGSLEVIARREVGGDNLALLVDVINRFVF